jgi:hypothetical protein
MGIFDRFINKAVKVPPPTNIVPQQLSRIRQDAATRKAAIEEAERAYFPYRVKMQQMYLNTKENAVIKAAVERRKDLTMLRKWGFVNANGEEDKATTDLFCNRVNGKTQLKSWFQNYLSYCLDAQYFGYSLINLNDIIDNAFPKISVVKRWNVSPDRHQITSFPYMTTGIQFLENNEYKDWFIYVDTPNDTGISNCGYGLFFELSIYEIFLRNLMGFNADYIEVNIAPFRQIKTNKTSEDERGMLEQVARDMGSSGYAVTDMLDEIVFHSSGGSGTGYNAYDLFEKRLEAKIYQLVLGHADAMISIPGKLGNEGEESPAAVALADKQSKDASFILPLVNQVLFTAMRNLGFKIADGVQAVMLNDNEENEITDTVTNIAVKMKQAGLQMDAKYFTEKTKIPVSETPTPTPKPTNITNKLIELYG